MMTQRTTMLHLENTFKLCAMVFCNGLVRDLAVSRRTLCGAWAAAGVELALDRRIASFHKLYDKARNTNATRGRKTISAKSVVRLICNGSWLMASAWLGAWPGPQGRRPLPPTPPHPPGP